MSSWYSLPQSKLTVSIRGGENGVSWQHSPVSRSLPSAVPEVASLCLIALGGFLPRIYLAVFWSLETSLITLLLLAGGKYFQMGGVRCVPFVCETNTAAVALVAAFLINVRWGPAHSFKHSLSPCREDVFAGATSSSVMAAGGDKAGTMGCSRYWLAKFA